MRKAGRIVSVLCGVAISVTVFAGPATAGYNANQCKKWADAWTKKNPHATAAQKQAEALKLAQRGSCNFTKTLKPR